MVELARAAATARLFAGARPFRVGAATGLRPVPAWKRDADFLFAQVSFSIDRLLAWRETFDDALDVYAGVMVVASAAMARRLAVSAPDIDVPDSLVAAVESDPVSGIDAALEMVDAIEASGAFAGVHLVPVSRYREVAARLEARH
jgi:methylenetetrahydrofolate reductase (NADPH)